MNYKDAKQLHNGDEITLKETGETTKVITTEVYEKQVLVHAMTSGGYSALHHRDIR